MFNGIPLFHAKSRLSFFRLWWLHLVHNPFMDMKWHFWINDLLKGMSCRCINNGTNEKWFVHRMSGIRVHPSECLLLLLLLLDSIPKTNTRWLMWMQKNGQRQWERNEKKGFFCLRTSTLIILWQCFPHFPWCQWAVSRRVVLVVIQSINVFNVWWLHLCLPKFFVWLFSYPLLASSSSLSSSVDHFEPLVSSQIANI